MKVSPTKNNNAASFKRALTDKELIEFERVKNESRRIMRYDKDILIISSHCLPQNPENNTGVGNFASEESQKFAKFMKTYLDINAIEDLPAGEIRPRGNFYCNYNASAFAMSPSAIDLRTLQSSEGGALITAKELEEAVNANNLKNRDSYVNFENVLEKDSPVQKLLYKAYKRFLSNGSEQMKSEFEVFKQNSGWLESKTVFKLLEEEYGHDNWKTWSEIDKNLMDGNPTPERLRYLKEKYAQKADFYSFVQYLADKHYTRGKNVLNKLGMKFIVDQQIGNTPDEVWANKRAFDTGHSLGWGLPAYDFDTITDEQSEAAKYIKRKTRLNAQRGDSIRFDVSWAYLKPRVDGTQKNLGTKLIEMIERTVQETKGADFDLRNLIHEFDAAPEEFQTNCNGRWIPELRGRTKALGTTYMSNSWGSNKHYLELSGQIADFILGAGNHDPQPLVQIAKGVPDLDGRIHKTSQLEPLSKLLEIPIHILENPVEFVKAKWAEVMTATNHQYHYTDVFGKEERFDAQSKNTASNYRDKVPHKFEKAYFDAVESGYGINIMDARAKAFKTRGYDKKHPELYAQMLKFRDILYEKTKSASDTIEQSKKGKVGWLLGLGALVLGGVWAYYEKGVKNKKSTLEN